MVCKYRLKTSFLDHLLTSIRSASIRRFHRPLGLLIASDESRVPKAGVQSVYKTFLGLTAFGKT